VAVSNLVRFSPPPGHSSGIRAYLPFAFAFFAGFFLAIVSPFSRVTSAPPAVRARYTAHKSFLFPDPWSSSPPCPTILAQLFPGRYRMLNESS
jgi:hypothetical protein